MQEQLDGERADQAHRRREVARESRRPRASAGRQAGRRRPISTRIPASWTVSRGREDGGLTPSMPRATMTDSSASKSSSRSTSSGPPSGRPTRPIADSMSAVAGDADLAAAVVAARRRLDPERRSRAPRRRPRGPPSVATSRHGATAIPFASTNRRSARRSCVMLQRLRPRADRRPLEGRADDIAARRARARTSRRRLGPRGRSAAATSS